MPNSLTPTSAPARLSLTLIPSTRTPLPSYSAARALMRGASSLQAEHHEAQTTITAGLPRRSARETVAPSIVGNGKSGAGFPTWVPARPVVVTPPAAAVSGSVDCLPAEQPLRIAPKASGKITAIVVFQRFLIISRLPPRQARF